MNFENYRQFVDGHEGKHFNNSATSTEYIIERLNHRHRVFFKHWNSIWPGRTVLDIGAADGRWGFSALTAGAKTVTMVEGLPVLFEKGKSNFQELRIDKTRFEFVNANIFDWKPSQQYDIVICAGFLTHIFNHPALFSIIRSLNPQFLLIDTSINGQQAPVIEPSTTVCTEGDSVASKDSVVIDNGNEILLHNWVARPSRTYVYSIAKSYDFDLVEDYNWKKAINDTTSKGVEDYWLGLRMTSLWKASNTREASLDLINNELHK